MPTHFEITHAFHPLFGKQIELVVQRAQWGEDRVFYRSPQGHLASLPARWTNLAPDDPAAGLADRPTHFRVDDLIELAALLSEVQR